MKPIITFLLFTTAIQGFSQGLLYQKNSNPKPIQKESILIEWRSSKVSFLAVDGTKRESVRFKNLDSIRYDQVAFRTFEIGKKRKGYFVIAHHDGYTLATLNKKYTVSRGGFPVDYSKHDVAVFKNDQLIDQISFTENNDRKNIDARISATKLIERYFGACESVREKLSQPYDGALKQGAIIGVLSSVTNPHCK